MGRGEMGVDGLAVSSASIRPPRCSDRSNQPTSKKMPLLTAASSCCGRSLKGSLWVISRLIRSQSKEVHA